MSINESTNKRGRKAGPVKVAFMRRVLPGLVPILESVIEDGVEGWKVDREEISGVEEKVKRLTEELEKAESRMKEMEKEKKVMSGELETARGRIVELSRRGSGDPSLQQAENQGLKKRIQELTAGIMRDGGKQDSQERLLTSMVGWEVEVFESWQAAKRREGFVEMKDKRAIDQEVPDIKGVVETK